MNHTSTCCWICHSAQFKCRDSYWVESVRNVFHLFQKPPTICQFIHHLHHMEFTSSSPFHMISEFIIPTPTMHLNATAKDYIVPQKYGTVLIKPPARIIYSTSKLVLYNFVPYYVNNISNGNRFNNQRSFKPFNGSNSNQPNNPSNSNM